MLRTISGGSRRLFIGLLAATVVGAASASDTTVAGAKDPLNYPLKQYGLILGVSLLGGLVAWGDKVRKGQLKAWNLLALVGELATASLAGLLCFWACEWANFAPNLTAALTGLAGYMGTRALVLAERGIERKYGHTGPAPLDGPPPPP